MSAAALRPIRVQPCSIAEDLDRAVVVAVGEEAARRRRAVARLVAAMRGGSGRPGRRIRSSAVLVFLVRLEDRVATELGAAAAAAGRERVGLAQRELGAAVDAEIGPCAGIEPGPNASPRDRDPTLSKMVSSPSRVYFDPIRTRAAVVTQNLRCGPR